MGPVCTYIRDLRMDGLDTFLFASPLSESKRLFMSTSQIVPTIDDAIRTGNLISQPQINPDFCLPYRLDGIYNLTLEIDVPTTPSILRKAASLDSPFNRTRQPEAEAMPTIRNGVAIKTDIGSVVGTTPKGDPVARPFLATPLQFDLLKLFAPRGVFVTDALNGIRRQMQVLRGACGQCLQVIRRQKGF